MLVITRKIAVSKSKWRHFYNISRNPNMWHIKLCATPNFCKWPTSRPDWAISSPDHVVSSPSSNRPAWVRGIRSEVGENPARNGIVQPGLDGSTRTRQGLGRAGWNWARAEVSPETLSNHDTDLLDPFSTCLWKGLVKCRIPHPHTHRWFVQIRSQSDAVYSKTLMCDMGVT